MVSIENASVKEPRHEDLNDERAKLAALAKVLRVFIVLGGDFDAERPIVAGERKSRGARFS